MGCASLLSLVICWHRNPCLAQGSVRLFPKRGSEMLASQKYYWGVFCVLFSEAKSVLLLRMLFFFWFLSTMHIEGSRILHNCKGIRMYVFKQSDPGVISPPSLFSVLGCVQMLHRFYLESNTKKQLCGTGADSYDDKAVSVQSLLIWLTHATSIYNHFNWFKFS